MRAATFVSLALVLASSLMPLSTTHAQPNADGPIFVLGFQTMASLIPDLVGQPMEDEHHGVNGDGLQQTTTGLMVWRKADNWTAFTNGSWTWVNGPNGIQDRSNNDRFPWEADDRAAAAPTSPPPSLSFAAPSAPAAPAVPAPASTSGSMPAPAGYSNLVFSDRFTGSSLDSSKWIPQIADQYGIWNDKGNLPNPLSAVGNHGGYNAEYGNPSEIAVGNGLTLNAHPDTSRSGYKWKAGYATTHGKFTFSGGYVQIKAKMPDSRTGGWGGLWFLEGGGEIDLQESGYTELKVDPNRVIASNLHTSGNSQKLYDTSVDLSADYHVYGMDYKPGKSITMYFDGKQIAQFTSNVPTGAYTIILTNTLAQNASGWHTSISGSTPSSLPMSVAEVQVWK